MDALLLTLAICALSVMIGLMDMLNSFEISLEAQLALMRGARVAVIAFLWSISIALLPLITYVALGRRSGKLKCKSCNKIRKDPDGPPSNLCPVDP